MARTSACGSTVFAFVPYTVTLSPTIPVPGSFAPATFAPALAVHAIPEKLEGIPRIGADAAAWFSESRISRETPALRAACCLV